MNNDDLQRQMDFIINQQATFSSDMIELKSRMDQQGSNIDKLASVVERLAETVEVQRQTVEGATPETQYAINNLIIANEATRELANRAAELAFNTSRRLTAHENKPHGQE
jgi:outer membrane murein-binding lipoprotein Lpp